MERSAVGGMTVVIIVAVSALCAGCSTSSTAEEGDNGIYTDGGGGDTGGGGGDAGGGHDSGTTDAGTPDAGPSDTGTSPDTACGDSAHARCKHLDDCSNDTLVSVRYGDSATCESMEKDNCLASLAAPSTGATPDTVEACAAALPGESCSDFLDANPAAACLPRAGSLDIGKPCAFSGQCASTYCSVPIGSLCGVCAAVPKQNDSCTRNADCGNRGGLTCQSNVCVVRGTLNEPCDSGKPCGPGLTCVTASGASTGSCLASGTKVGDPCDPKHQTAAGCDRNLGLGCDSAAKTCAAVTLVDANQACDKKLIDCRAGANCVIPSGAKQGTCVAAAQPSGACDTGPDGPSCMPNTRCVWSSADAGTAGVCTLPDGQACK